MRSIFLDLKLFLTLVFISLILVLFDTFNLLTLPKLAVEFIASPIQYGLYHYGKGISDQFGFIFAGRLAAKENIALKKQLSDLLSENAGLRTQLNQAKIIADQQVSLPFSTYPQLPANVIGVGRFLTLDEGSLDGVKIGQAVVFKDSFIGKINQVGPKQARVILPQDPESKISAFAQDKSGKAKGILEGQFGSDLLMNKILHQEPIEVGDLVYSQGAEGDIPRGLILGKVSKVLDKQDEVFKTAKVIPIYNSSDLDLVFIILGS